MKKSKHTPGPWEVRRTTRPGVWKRTGNGWVKIADVEAPDMVPAFKNRGRTANARLIAAAPDLYDSLKMIEWSGCVGSDEETGYCPCCEWAMPTHDPECFVGNTLKRVESDDS